MSNGERPRTAEGLLDCFQELTYDGTLEEDRSENNPSYAPEPAVTHVEAPLTDDDAKYADFEIELDPGVDLRDITADKLVDGLSDNQLRQLIKKAESQESSPRHEKSLQDEIDGLSNAQLGELIARVSKNGVFS
jgi:hypothetical protein